MKFVFITDSHSKVRGPSLRLDNYAETVLEKFAEVGRVAQQIGAQAVLHGGDLFDSARVADSHKGDLGRLIQSWKAPMYVVPGNHDEFGWTATSLDSTSLGLFVKLGIVKPLLRSTGPAYFVDPNQHLTVSVTGQEYHHELDRRDPALDYYVDEDVFCNFRILIAHSMLLPKPFLPDQACTLIDDVPVDTPTSPDLILCGHYHPGWPTVTRGTVRPTIFANPGSMLRTDVGWDNMNRTPGYLIIDVKPSGITVTRHEFECAKPSSVVLNRAARDAQNERAKTLEAFRQQIDENANLKGVDLVSIMDQIITSEGLPAELRESAIKRMEAAEETVEDGVQHLDCYAEKPWPYYITKVEAENFQSWEKLEVDLVAGFNVIVGPSDKGKSAILRVIRWVLEDKPKGSDFIRWGAPKKTRSIVVDGEKAILEYQVLGSLTFSDGSKLTRGRTEKSSGFYLVEYPDGTTKLFKAFGRNIPPDVYNVSQMPPLPLGATAKSINLQTQHEGTFLLSDEASVRAAAIGRLTGVQVVDAAIREVGRDIMSAQRDVKAKQRDRERLATELAAFDDLPAEQQILDSCEVALVDAGAVQSELDLIVQSQRELAALNQGKAVALAEIEDAKAKIAAESLVNQALALASEVDFLAEMKQQLGGVKWAQVILSDQVRENRRVAALEPLLAEARTLQEALDFLNSMVSDLNAVRKNLTSETEVLAQASQKAVAADQVTAASQLLSELQALSELEAELKVTRESAANALRRCREQDREVQQAVKAYARKLQEIGVCPTCSSPIGPERVSEIISHHLH